MFVGGAAPAIKTAAATEDLEKLPNAEHYGGTARLPVSGAWGGGMEIKFKNTGYIQWATSPAVRWRRISCITKIYYIVCSE